MKTVKVRKLILGQGRPKICVPLTGRSLEELGRQLDCLKNYPADMLEWRCDWFEGIGDRQETGQALTLIRRQVGDLPLLVTFRTIGEGGEQEIEKEDYFSLLDDLACREEPDLLDMEAWFDSGRTADMAAGMQNRGKKVVLSYHNFSLTPPLEEMTGRLREMAAMGADLAKIAVMPGSMEDVYRLLRATSMVHALDLCPLITIAMGRQGLLSRLCGEISGSCLTFGSAGTSSAPGQAAADRLKLILDEIHQITAPTPY